MITWICKTAAALCAALALSGCDGGQAVLGGLANLAGQKTPAPRLAVMAGGAVTLSAPSGYCIDPAASGQRFALLARCDVLNGSGTGIAPLSIITVSLSPAAAENTLPSAQITAAALGLSAVENVDTNATRVIFLATGQPPGRALDGRHWRTTVLVGGQIMAAALYGPKGTPPIGREGRAILSDLIAGTRATK